MSFIFGGKVSANTKIVNLFIANQNIGFIDYLVFFFLKFWTFI